MIYYLLYKGRTITVEFTEMEEGEMQADLYHVTLQGTAVHEDNLAAIIKDIDDHIAIVGYGGW